MRIRLEAGDEVVEVALSPVDLALPPAWRDGEDLVTFRAGEGIAVRPAKAIRGDDAAAHGGEVRAPMPGRIVAVSARNGDKVAKGAPLLVMEAMKMEYALTAPAAGKVDGLTATVGAQVEEGSLLARIAQ